MMETGAGMSAGSGCSPRSRMMRGESTRTGSAALWLQPVRPSFGSRRLRRGLAGLCSFHPALRRDGKCRGRKTTPSAGGAPYLGLVAGNQLKERESVGEYDLTRLTDEELRQLE
jgi:hypothetical protein